MQQSLQHIEMLSKAWELIKKYNPNKILIDGANPSFIRSLKIQLGERLDYENIPKENWKYMKVLPINFNQEHKTMLTHCKMPLEQGYVTIHPSHDKLITSLRTAVEYNGMLDKETTSYNDIFDAYRLALRHYTIDKGEEEKGQLALQTRFLKLLNIPFLYCLYGMCIVA
jgi:hypothetical protein